MFKQTFTNVAVETASEIKTTNLKAQRVDALQAMAARLVGEPVNAEPTGEFVALTSALREASRKSELRVALEELADYVLMVNKNDQRAKYRFITRNEFYGRVRKSIDALMAKTQAAVARISQDTNLWDSYVGDIMTLKAKHEIAVTFCRHVEHLCLNLRLSKACETALHRMQAELLRNIGNGLSRSTSTVRNAADDGRQQARSQLLYDATGHGLYPFDHTEKKEA